MLARAAARSGDPAEALVPRGQARARQLFSPLLTLTDDPLVPQGFGSRIFDSEGIAAKPRADLRQGRAEVVLHRHLLRPEAADGADQRLVVESVVAARREVAEQLLADMKDGLLDHRLHRRQLQRRHRRFLARRVGFRVRNGAIAEPVSEMNISGNHLDFWKQLVAVGNDPFAYRDAHADAGVRGRVGGGSLSALT